MALNTANVTFPNALNSVDSTQAERLALVIEEFTGMVEGTINRRSVLADHIPVRSVKGTATFTNHAVGKSTLQKVTPGVAPDGIKSDFAKHSVTVDTVIASREFFPILDVFQTQMDTRREVANEQGKEIAKFKDQAFFIQALKAARLANSAYANGTPGKPAGHLGGTIKTLPTLADAQDPAKLYAKLLETLTAMELKDVDPRQDDVVIALRPDFYTTLIQAEQLVNMQYTTAAGNKVNDGWVLKAAGVPVISTNNMPNTNVSGHFLSNTFNGNAYDGDFTKTVAAVFSPRAIMAGETIPVTSDVFFDKLMLSWCVHSYLSFAVGTNRAEYAAEIAYVA